MIVKISRIITCLIFLLTALMVTSLAFFPNSFPNRLLRSAEETVKPKEVKLTRVIERGEPFPEEGSADRELDAVYQDAVGAKIVLENDEIPMRVLTENFDDDPQEEQIIVYRKLLGNNDTIRLAYVDFDEETQTYKRLWDDSTPVERTGTVSLYTQDLLGDRSICVILSGMNGAGEYTFTVFRKNSEGKFRKIARIQIDGAVSIQETSRSQAYQMGMTRGKGFSIVAYGRDVMSANILDRIEIVYTYNKESGIYEQSKLTRIPSKQAEEKQVREILSDGARSFENFIAGLWYFVDTNGTIDKRRYLYFDPQNREVIFYIEEIQQQVFTWQQSNATRSGLHLMAQNISVQTLRRSLDITLESLESVRVKVFEDVRLKIGNDTSWDGLYRKASSIGTSVSQDDKIIPSHIDAVYNGIIGKIRFALNGDYELISGNTGQKGKYSFFEIENQEMLELRPENSLRETYIIKRPTGSISLQRARIGASGVQEIHEPAILLSLEETF